MEKFIKTLADVARSRGAGEVGVSSVTPPKGYEELTSAITVVYPLSESIVRGVLREGRPTCEYFHHYRTVNAEIDSIALSVVSAVEKQGFCALPIAASQSIPSRGGATYGLFPHKTAAVKSGLGFIGKNGLFVSRKFGCAVRIATVLTDMDLNGGKSVQACECGDCDACRLACPAGAIYGVEYSEGMPRSEIIDAEKCSRFMKSEYMSVGRGSVCGVCLAVCPKNFRWKRGRA